MARASVQKERGRKRANCREIGRRFAKQSGWERRKGVCGTGGGCGEEDVRNAAKIDQVAALYVHENGGDALVDVVVRGEEVPPLSSGVERLMCVEV